MEEAVDATFTDSRTTSGLMVTVMSRTVLTTIDTLVATSENPGHETLTR
jgi:hypothetical protein